MQNILKKEETSHKTHDAVFLRKRLIFGGLPILATYLVAIISLNLTPRIPRTTETETAKPAPSQPASHVVPLPKQLIFHKKIVLTPGSTLASLLQSNRISAEEQRKAIQSLKPHLNLRDIKAGSSLSMHYSPSEEDQDIRLEALHIRRSFDEEVVLERTKKGHFHTRRIKNPTTQKQHVIRGTIQTCFYQDASKQGITPSMLHEIIQALGHKFDLQRDFHPGDQFSILVEQTLNQKTKQTKQTKCLMIQVTLRGKRTRIYYFKHKRHPSIHFFDDKGQGLKSYFLRTPVDGARLTSGFGYRSHPILGYTKLHRGVDFGAPTGTPIMAAGDGIVKKAFRNGSYGNYILIQHASGYRTAYAHLSRFRKGLRAGRRVKQGEVIGYVGATGRVTGPHLHFELHKNGRPINPKSVKMLPSVKLLGKDRKEFRAHIKKLDTLYQKHLAT